MLKYLEIKILGGKREKRYSRYRKIKKRFFITIYDATSWHNER